MQQTSAASLAGENPAEQSRQASEFRRFVRVFFGRKVALFSSVLIVLVILVAILAPVLAPHDPFEQDLKQVLQLPSTNHLLGTDQLGRDVLSRLIYGARTSLIVGIVSVGIAAAAGLILGLIAGYFGGWLNSIIMRFIDALMAIPPIPLSLAIAAMLGGGITNIMISVGISLIPLYCRIICGKVLSIRENDYIVAADIIGSNNLRVMFLHLLPNCSSTIIVLITLNLGIAILAEASLSFLGVGIAPPGAAWGSMVQDGIKYLRMSPLLSFAPGLCIMLVVWSFNMIGDGLRDALDPRLRGTI